MKTNQLFVYMRGHPDWVDKEAIPKSYDQISSDNRYSCPFYVLMFITEAVSDYTPSAKKNILK